MAKVTEEIIDKIASMMLNSESYQALNKYISQDGYSAQQRDKIIAEAKERIRSMCRTTQDIQREINLYRLNDIVRQPNSTFNDKLKAIDLLNKMNGEYTQQIELKTDCKFILGVEQDDFVKPPAIPQRDIDQLAEPYEVQLPLLPIDNEIDKIREEQRNEKQLDENT